MAEESYQCSIELFKDLPGEKNAGDERLEEMYDMLPKHFKPKDLEPLYKSFNISLILKFFFGTKRAYSEILYDSH